MIGRGDCSGFLRTLSLLFLAMAIQGCSTSLRFAKGDKGLAFLEGVDKVRVEFDRSSISVGFDRAHCFSEETFLRTRPEPWRKKWVSYREKVYEPRFDSLLNYELAWAGSEMEVGTSVKNAEQRITIVVEHIYMGDLSHYHGPGSPNVWGGGNYQYPEVSADLRIIYHRKGERDRPQAVFRYDRVTGKPMSVLVDLPVASFLKSIYEKTGRELGEQILNSL